jgi:hypothetical protein
VNGLQPSTTLDFFMQDEILNNGESYDLAMTTDKTLALQGLQLEIDDSGTKLQFDAITSNVLPGFDMETNVNFEGDKIVIRYVVPIEVMEAGTLRIDAGEPILQFHITSLANGILSDELHLLSNAEQYMKVRTVNERVGIRLFWEEEISSRVKDLQLKGISVYPNPAFDKVLIAGDENLGMLSYTVSDISGRVLASGQTDAQTRDAIDLSAFSEGMYVLSLRTSDGRRTAQKLIIQR